MRDAQIKIAIVSSGYMPVPNVMGGAVEALETLLIDQNEEKKNFLFDVYSTWSQEAEDASSAYRNSRFKFIRNGWLTSYIDGVICSFFTKVLHRTKTISYSYILRRLIFIYKVAKLISESEYDLLILENHATLFLTLKLFGNGHRYKDKVIFHVHNEVNSTYGCDRELCSALKYVGVSRFVLESLKRKHPRIDLNKGIVLKNCSDLGDVQFNIPQSKILEYRRNKGISEDDVVVLFAGRIIPEKGLDRLLDAIEELGSKKLKLLIAGGVFFGSKIENDYEKTIEKKILALGERVICLGYVSHNEMPIVYASADICCIPSVWDEPAGLTVIEPMFAGKPLVLSNSGGIPEYADEKCALFVERDETMSENLARTIRILQKDACLRRKMGLYSLEKSKEYLPASYYENFKSIVMDCLDSKPVKNERVGIGVESD